MSEHVAGPETGKYVYCIIRCPTPREFGPIGIGADSRRVFTVHHADIAAVVSDTAGSVAGPAPTDMLAHEQVNETVMREFTAIPMGFGSLTLRSSEDLVELLRSAYGALDDVLDRMTDKLEFSLQVSWDRERALEIVVSEDDGEIRRLRDEIDRKARGSTYFARMQLVRLLDVALEEAGTRLVREVHEALKPVVVATRSRKPADERAIMNVALLVERDREMHFRQRVDEISRTYDGLLTLKTTGPCPPASFASVKLDLGRSVPVRPAGDGSGTKAPGNPARGRVIPAVPVIPSEKLERGITDEAAPKPESAN